jgi:hypothetical protein
MFIAMLTVIALVDYVIIFCCIVDMVAKPMVKTVETQRLIFDGEQTINSADMGFVCDDEEFKRFDEAFNSYDKDLNSNGKDFNSYIEEQNSRIAALSSNVNEILSNIDAIVEGDKVNQGVLSE